jgi:Tol biopolymer transport system component/predicted Ser/Thr protein kinase
MPLAPGTKIGLYEILGSLGAGGMGEVYRARDTRLGRDVAIKIIPDSFAKDPDRRARFEREARALAALNHPNIAQIYGVEGHALIMELVDGRDLEQAKDVDPLGVARQLVDALDAAHAAGIVHRDLKPGNIRVTDGGVVKVLDFGLAKALAPAGDGSSGGDQANTPTLTSPAMTEAGLILGTAAYMSPEQARGRPVDKRADIWAFGVILFELLSGRRLFQGETVSDTLASVLRQEIPWEALPASTPASVRRLLVRCLERDPKMRLRDIGDARADLDPSAASVPASAAVTPTPAGLSGMHILIWAASLLVVGGVATYLGWIVKPTAPRPPREFVIATETGATPTLVALSPDGRYLAYATEQAIYLRPLAQATVRAIPGSDDARALMWSPDSAWLAFQSRGQLSKAPVSGAAPPVAIARVVQDFTPVGSGAWLPDDRLVFATGSSQEVFEVSAEGGSPKTLFRLDQKTESDVHDLTSLPDGSLLFVVHPLDMSKGYHLETFTGGERKRISRMPEVGFRSPVFSSTGHILFEDDRRVWALPFSATSRESTGEPFLVRAEAGRPFAAPDGTLVMLPRANEPRELVWVDRAGKVSAPISAIVPGLEHMRLSPDGLKVLASVTSSGNADLYLFDANRRAETRLTYEPQSDVTPAWSKDGLLVTYNCGGRICQRPVDGTGERTVLSSNVFNTAVSPDGRYLVFSRERAGALGDLFTLELAPNGRPGEKAEPVLYIGHDRQQRVAEVSPDGRFALYDTNESGRYEVFATRFPKAEGKWPVSRGPGLWPRWNAKGDRAYFVDDQGRIVEVDVRTTPTFEAGPARVVIDAATFGADPRRDRFERSLDDQRFLIARAPQLDKLRNTILLIENWPAWYRARQ